MPCGRRPMKAAQRQRSQQPRSRAAKRGQSGVVLIEALVGIMIFSIGVLGLVGLQATMVKTQTQANFRAEAAQLAQDLVGRMWVDTENLAAYSDAGQCESHTFCAQWLERVADRLPGGIPPEVTTDGARTEIVLTWVIPGEPDDDGRHSFRTVTSVSGQPKKDD